MTLTELAESAYLAYGNATGWRGCDGYPVPWCDLSETTQHAWRAVAEATRTPSIDVHVHNHCGAETQPVLARLGEIGTQLTRMENRMVTEAAAFDELNAKFTALAGDVRALLDLFEQERDNLSPEGLAKFQELSAGLTSLNEEVGDRDGSEAPAEPEPGA